MIEKLKKIRNQISEIEKEAFEKTTPLKREFKEVKRLIIENHEIKVDDKVEVEIYNGTKKIAFVSEVDLHYNFAFKYGFNAVKKDGTMSKQSSGIWSFKTIKKIN